jgi:hypothetical protein
MSSPSSFEDDIKCYALPYGVLGFVSHMLTYYAYGMLLRKLGPRRHNLKRKKLDIFLSIFGLVATVTIAIVNGKRCSHNIRKKHFGPGAPWETLGNSDISRVFQSVRKPLRASQSQYQ